MERDDEHLDPALQARIRGALDDAADDLDMVSASRLQAARRRAVARAGRRRGWSGWWGVMVPAGATAALAAALLYTPPEEATTPVRTVAAPAEAVRDLDLLTASESLQFYEDYEMLRWLPSGQRS